MKNNTKLLRVTFKGLSNFPVDGLTLDFLPQANVIQDNIDREFIKLDTNLFYPKVNIITGSNATGKSTLLELLSFALSLPDRSFMITLTNSISFLADFNFISLIEDELIIDLVLYSSGMLKKCIYKAWIEKGRLEYKLDFFDQKKYNSRDKKNIFTFNENLLDLLKKDHPVTKSKNDITYHSTFVYTEESILISYYTPATIRMTPNNIWLYKNDINSNLLESLVMVLDKNIESFAHKDGKFNIKFAGMETEYGLTQTNLFNKLSDGTKKTVLLFFMITNVLEVGGTLIIDEIENHLNKSIVDLIIDLFQDERVNVNGANIIFSTHYAELLDEVNRSDAIFITNSENGKLVVNNAYNLLKGQSKQRKELKKSKLYISGLLNSKPSYERVNNFKKSLISMNKRQS